MARQARITLDNSPHHITQRGNRGELVFFEKGDFQSYIDTLKEQCDRFNVKILSYCLLPNQIHLLVTPQNGETLARAIGETHRRYTNMINKRNNWRGHLFQDRFFSYVCDETYSLRAMRFIENMPVISGIAPKPESYLWSSARDRIKVTQDSFVAQPKNFHAVQDWSAFLERSMDVTELKEIERHLQTGRPRGHDTFLDMIEQKIGHTVRPKKRGRKPKAQKNIKSQEEVKPKRSFGFHNHIRSGT